MITMSARAFNQSVAQAQRLAEEEPVMVTRRGKPAYVLMSIAEYERLVEIDNRPLSQRLAPVDGVDLDDEEFDRILVELRRESEFGRPTIELD